MSGKTTIEWATDVWNPVRGCTKVSRGCDNCYAMRMAHRFSGKGQPYEGLTRIINGRPQWIGNVRCVPEVLDQPLRWTKPKRIFVASMADPNHDSVPDDFRDRMLAVIALTPQHTYQWLTKRAANLRAYFADSTLPFRVQRAIDAIEVDQEMHGVVEEWRSVDGYVGHYEVSNYGAVRSKTGRQLAPRPHPHGYATMSLSKDAVVSERLVHRLVLTAFARPPADDEDGSHRNGNRSDNRIANLSWKSKTGNMADAARHGTAGLWMKGRATLTAEQVAEIRRRRARGEKLDDIAAAVGSNRKQVSAVARGEIYKPAAIAWPLPNLHLGVSVEDQATADERIPLLLQTPAAVRWISAEPLLGPLDLWPWINHNLPSRWPNSQYQPRGPFLDWLVAGGESGPKARPSHPDWFRSLRDQCQAASVPFFMKQITESGRKVPFEKWPTDLQIMEYPNA